MIGFVGADPEVRYGGASGSAMCALRVATSHKYKNKDGEPTEETEWSSVALYGQQAENAGKYLKKGSAVYIDGRLRTRKWVDKSGADKYTTEVVPFDIIFLSRTESPEEKQPIKRASQTSHSTAPAASAAPKSGPDMPFSDMDDDIPF